MTGNEATLAVIDALEACSIPYMLVGSYSSNVYGVERSTQDADFVVDWRRGRSASFPAASDADDSTRPADEFRDGHDDDSIRGPCGGTARSRSSSSC